MNDKILQYIEKGYARKLSEEELSEKHQNVWYLPVFPVTNLKKPGKIRLVWDAAAKVNDVCLNTVLLKGPDQVTPLLAVLFRFRERSIAMSADLLLSITTSTISWIASTLRRRRSNLLPT